MYRYVRPADTNITTETTTSKNAMSAPSADFIILDKIGKEDSIDLLNLNLPARLLVVLSNISYLQNDGLRNLSSLFANENMPISASSMISALTNVERAVTQLFLQGQVGKVIGPIQSGWLEASSSTLNLSNDTVSLSPAIFKSLLSLADIQALISDVSPRDPLPLLRDVSNALTSTILNYLKDRSNLTRDQLIQAHIDAEFVKRKLENASLLSSESKELFDRIFEIVQDVEGVDFYPIWGQFESNWTGPFSNLFSF